MKQFADMNAEPLLTADQISKQYESDEKSLHPMSFELQALDRVGIVGETGSGKSTFLKILGGLVQTDSGVVKFKGTKVIGPEDSLIPGHKKIAYLSQHFELPKFISVFEHLDDPYLIAPDDAEKIYQACHVDHLLDRDTRALSGGEKQRVALAKLLLKSPDILLLDEPFSNLDFVHKRIIRQVMEEVESALNTTVILVAHDPRDVLSWATRVMVFAKGEVVQEGTPVEVYEKSVSEQVAGLFGTYCLINPVFWGINESEIYPRFDGKLLVRPERFKVSVSGFEGLVTDQLFFGAFDEIKIAIAQENIILNAEPGQYRVGDKIKVQLIAE